MLERDGALESREREQTLKGFKKRAECALVSLGTGVECFSRFLL